MAVTRKHHHTQTAMVSRGYHLAWHLDDIQVWLDAVLQNKDTMVAREYSPYLVTADRLSSTQYRTVWSYRTRTQ